MARLSETYTFLSSYRNPEAQDFVRNLMKQNYTRAVLEHHPFPDSLEEGDIQNKCNSLVDHIFDHINALQYPLKLFSLFRRLSRSAGQRKSIWFDEFLEAYENYKHRTKLKNRYQQLKPYIKGPAYCDVGCGGGDLVAYMKENHPDIEEVAGIDVLDWRSEAVRNVIDFQMLDLTQPGVSSRKAYDTLTCLAVLHHIDNRNGGLEYFLRNLKTAMKSNGKLVVEEDVILPAADIDSKESVREQIDRARNTQPLFEKFLHFDHENQRDIITIIDFLSNTLVVGVSDMPFPCSFQTLADWEYLFWENGFVIHDLKIEGFVSSRFNQSSHVIFLLEKEK